MNRPAQARGSGNYPKQPGGQEHRNEASSIQVSPIRFGDSIDAKLYSDIAEATARDLGSFTRAGKNKPTQLRRFYDELVMLQEKVGGDGTRYAQQAPFIQMLKAKVAYARGRDKVDVNFEKLLRHVIDQAQDAGTLKQAKLFMEAFMAFYKVYGPQER